MKISLIDLAAHRAFFRTHGQEVVFKKNQFFANPYDIHPWVYYLEEGMVKLSFDMSGDERILGYFVPNMMFAQTRVFYESDSGNIQYSTVTKAKAIRISRERYLQEIETNAALQHEYIQCLLHNQTFLIDRVVFHGENNVEKKFLRWVLFMLKFYGIQTDTQHYIGIPLTQETISHFVHVSRETINKVMAHYIKEGLIAVEKKHIYVKDLDAIHDALKCKGLHSPSIK